MGTKKRPPAVRKPVKKPKPKAKPTASAKKPPVKLNGHVNGHSNGVKALPKPAKKNPEYRGHAMLLNGYKPEYCQQAALMVLNGALEGEIRRQFGVTKNVFNEWKIIYPEFAASLAITAEASLADARVVRSIYEQSVGYEVDTMKIMQVEGDIKKVKYKKHINADFNAAKFWLQNRDPLKWSRGGGAGGDGGGQGHPTQININMIKNMDTDQLDASIAVLEGIMGQGGGGGKIVRIDKKNATDAEAVDVPKAKKGKK